LAEGQWTIKIDIGWNNVTLHTGRFKLVTMRLNVILRKWCYALHHIIEVSLGSECLSEVGPKAARNSDEEDLVAATGTENFPCVQR
jgi:hypothetical protein